MIANDWVDMLIRIIGILGGLCFGLISDWYSSDGLVMA